MNSRNTQKTIQPDTIVGGKAVVYDKKGRILIMRRSEMSAVNPGMWDFPGGKLEIGEDPREGVKREIIEETGLKPYKVEPLDVVSFFNTNKQFVVVVGYSAYVRSNQVTLSLEHDQYMWVTEQEAVKIPLPQRHLRFLKRARLSS